MNSEFNLITEEWIRVRTKEGRVADVSLAHALENAHLYTALAGELPTQDAAVFRFLLAVLHTIFGRVDENGEAGTIDEEDDAFDRWEALWENGKFPKQPIRDYLTKWRDRFWLFDDAYPFYQVAEARRAKAYTTSKLIGDLLESENKLRLFPSHTGKAKESVPYAEAARWLLYLNAWDDTALKKTRGMDIKESASVGWVGKLGYVALCGNNLFESLMLNLTFMNNGEELWDSRACLPAWELEQPRIQELSPIAVPNHPAALLTVQSRRIYLLKENGAVTGYHLLSGDLMNAQNALREQQTLWRSFTEKTTGKMIQTPLNHDPSRQMWREFSSIAVSEKVEGRPGVIGWIQKLQSEDVLKKDRHLKVQIASICYDSSASHTVQDTFSDSLSFHSNLLSETGRQWRGNIEEEISHCEQAADYIGYLVSDLCKASGMSTEGNGGERTLKDKMKPAKEQLFAQFDMPFRAWLVGLSAEQGSEDRAAAVNEWRETARGIALSLGKELVEQAGQEAFIGRTRLEKKKNKQGKMVEETVRYCAPKAFNYYQSRINKLYGEV